jgi:preprotein translocase SecE subunit
VAKQDSKPAKDDSAKSKKKRSLFSRGKKTKKSPKKSSDKKDGNPVSNYFKGAYSELKKVAWPDRKESVRLTIGVVIYSLAFALFIALVDYIFDIGFERFIV